MYDIFIAPSFEILNKSVHKIYVNSSFGTCTIMRLDRNHLLILTCFHLFDGNIKDNFVDFKIECKTKEIEMHGEIIKSKLEEDILFIIVENDDFMCDLFITEDKQSYHVPLDCQKGDEIFILGFPFITKFAETSIYISEENFFSESLYRHGYISGEIKDKNEEKRYLLLDLHNNPGFSGAPVCKIIKYPNHKDVAIAIIGVISGYYWDEIDNKSNSLTNSDFTRTITLHNIMHEFLSSEYSPLK